MLCRDWIVRPEGIYPMNDLEKWNLFTTNILCDVQNKNEIKSEILELHMEIGKKMNWKRVQNKKQLQQLLNVFFRKQSHNFQWTALCFTCECHIDYVADMNLRGMVNSVYEMKNATNIRMNATTELIYFEFFFSFSFFILAFIRCPLSIWCKKNEDKFFM